MAQLGAQLPMLVRGFYYEGWRPNGAVCTMRHKHEFLAPDLVKSMKAGS